MRTLIRFFLLGCFVLAFAGCTPEQIVVNPSENTPASYIHGRIMYNTTPLKNYYFQIDTTLCVTDSLGYFYAENLSGKTTRLQLQHYFYRNVDTLLPLTTSGAALVVLTPRSESYFPLTIGSYWKYSGPKSFMTTLTGTEQFGGYSWVRAESMYSDSTKQVTYYRESNDTIYKYQSECGTTVVYCLFKVGSNITYSWRKCDLSGSWPVVGTMYRSGNSIFSLTFAVNKINPDLTVRFEKGIGLTRSEPAGTEAQVLQEYYIAY